MTDRFSTTPGRTRGWTPRQPRPSLGSLAGSCGPVTIIGLGRKINRDVGGVQAPEPRTEQAEAGQKERRAPHDVGDSGAGDLRAHRSCGGAISEAGHDGVILVTSYTSRTHPPPDELTIDVNVSLRIRRRDSQRLVASHNE